MRAALLPLALIAAAGCTREPPMAMDPPGRCDADAARMRFAGARFELSMREAVRREARARIVRVIRQGDPVTMDYRPDRLTVTLDDTKHVVGLACG